MSAPLSVIATAGVPAAEVAKDRACRPITLELGELTAHRVTVALRSGLSLERRSLRLLGGLGQCLRFDEIHSSLSKISPGRSSFGTGRS